MKNCISPNCKQVNPQSLDSFYIYKRDNTPRGKCKSCYSEDSKIWGKNNKEKRKSIYRKYYSNNVEHAKIYCLRKKYWPNLSLEAAKNEYNKLLEQQNSACKICRRSEQNKRNNKISELAVDHCHKTGEIRGLLCGNCNKAIGLFKDDISLLTRTIKYLQKEL